MTLASILDEAIIHAAHAAYGEALDFKPATRQATKPEFGHMQSSFPLALAKILKEKPLVVAEKICAHLDLSDTASFEVLAPGFVNFTFKEAFLLEQLGKVDPVKPQGKVVVDYSSPNVAKQMHVGHLRSTVIGDTLSRAFEAMGFEVVRANHIGDWGTQFGMLVEEVLTSGLDISNFDLDALNALYKKARSHFESDEAFTRASRERVVALQSGDKETLSIWSKLVDLSLSAFNHMYERLDVSLKPSDVVGESFYNAQLSEVVDDLQAKGLLTESDGALCAFMEPFSKKDGTPLPLIIKKTDGGFGYAATDLAAIRHRVKMGATKLVYVVDARQSLHFEQVFKLARLAGWADGVEMTHVAFGTVLGSDGKPFKTRQGETITLSSLLDDADAAAFELLRPRPIEDSKKNRIAHQVALAAIKFGDLSNDLVRDYTFSLERMMKTTGATGPYLQYAAVRLSRLLEGQKVGTPTALTEPSEVTLALKLVTFSEVLTMVLSSLEPHHLCSYLYELASAFSAFYEACPVLKAPEPIRANRLALAAHTQRVLSEGLYLLGVKAPESM